MKKMKHILGLFAAASLVMFTSCGEDAPVYTPAEAEGPTAGVYFETGAQLLEFEVDRAETSFTLAVSRQDASNALTANLTVVENQGDAFSVPATVAFAAGQKTAEVTVNVNPNLPAAEVYKLTIQLTGEGVVSNYVAGHEQQVEFQYSIYEYLGKGQFFDEFVSYNVKLVDLWKHANENTIRMSYPYTTDVLIDAEWDGWFPGETQRYIYYYLSDDGYVTWDDYWTTNLIYKGEPGQHIYAWLPSSLASSLTAADANSVYYTKADGSIAYLRPVPYYYILDDGGGFGLYACYVGFPGFDLAGALGVDILE